jgi:hypothetical protein
MEGSGENRDSGAVYKAMPACDEITTAVEEYNGKYSALDSALRSALDATSSLPSTSGRFLAEVCLIADWGSIPFLSFQHRVALANEIEASWPVLHPMRSWHAENWDDETRMLIRAVESLSDTHLLSTPGVKRRQLSFLSKYLHACVHEAFPIWDKNARTALHSDNDEASWPSYRDWVIRVRQEAATHRACCLEQLRPRGEGLLRTLDKALYIIGGKVLAGKRDKGR